ncbi:MAG: DUF3040 domain-containing protein [Streptosporangiaceae bacterium]
MSLAPAERRALDGIEDSLRRSDPRLARMLTRFSLPLSRGGLVILARSIRQRRLLVVSVLTVATLAVVVVAALHRPAPPVPCAAAGTVGLVAPGTQASACLSPQPKSHATSTGQTKTGQTKASQTSAPDNGTTGWPADLGTP